jgi:hypothetical protein
MSMKTVEDRFGQVLSFEASGNHDWRRFVGLYFLAGIILLWSVLAFVLIRDLEIGWITKIILLAVATLVARLFAYFLQALLTPRSGVRQLRFDPAVGEARLIRHSVFRRPKAENLPLSSLSQVRIAANSIPSISLSGVLAAAKAAQSSGELDQDELAQKHFSSMPLGFRFRMMFDPEADLPTVEAFDMAVEGVVTEEHTVALGYRIAAAAGLGYQQVYTVPEVGFEIHLSRDLLPGLEPIPESELQLEEQAARSLGKAGPPPFDPDSLQADHRIQEWSPGRSVVFERIRAKARFLALPFTALVLVGPALLLLDAAGASPFNKLGVVVFSGLGLVVGGIAMMIVRSPARRVEIDWAKREIAVTRRSKRDVFLFDELEKLELEGVQHEGGGESGGTWFYWCKLNAIRRNGDGKTPVPVELLSTRRTQRSDEPWRQATPLLEALAAALDVEAETKGYR